MAHRMLRYIPCTNKLFKRNHIISLHMHSFRASQIVLKYWNCLENIMSAFSTAFNLLRFSNVYKYKCPNRRFLFLFILIFLKQFYKNRMCGEIYYIHENERLSSFEGFRYLKICKNPS